MAQINVKLPRLTKGWQEQPQLMERYWDIAMTKIETSINEILAIPAIEAALTALDAATTAAQTAADNAQTAADTVTAETSLQNSYVSNFTSPLISADSSGNVTIANHDRVYGNGDVVSVTGDTIATGQANPDVLRFYYDDAARTGGTVTYAYTVDPAAPPSQTGDRHSVGAVEIPAAGSQDGENVKPPGFVDLR